MSSLQPKTGGKLGALTLIYIMVTHVLACITGGLLTFAIKPGAKPSNENSSVFSDVIQYGGLENKTEKGELAYMYDDAIADMLRNMFPENIFKACFSHIKTSRIRDINFRNITRTKVEHLDGPNMIGLSIFSFALGLGIITSGKMASPVRNLFDGLYHVFIKILMAITWFGPIGIMSLIASAIIQATDLLILVESLGLLTLTFVASLAIHQLILMPVAYGVIVRKNPFRYHWELMDSLIAVFAAASCMVALPNLIKACEKRLKIDSRIVQFVLPVTVVMNAPGSVMYMMMGVFFIAQSYGIVMNVGAIIISGILCSILGTTVAVAPYSSLVTMLLIATSLDLPLTSGMIGLFYSIDWLLDRLKGTSNTLCQGYCAGIMEKLVYDDKSVKEKDVNINETALGDTPSVDEGIYCPGSEDKEPQGEDVVTGL